MHNARSEGTEPAEKTRDLYRFRVEAKPGEPVKLQVVEEQVHRTEMLLTNADDAAIQVFLAAKVVRRALCCHWAPCRANSARTAAVAAARSRRVALRLATPTKETRRATPRLSQATVKSRR